MLTKRRILQIFLLLSDAGLIFATLFLTLGIRFGDFSFLPESKTQVFVYHFLLIGPLWILLLYLLDFYRVPPVKDGFYFVYNLVVLALSCAGLGFTYFYLRPRPGIEPKTILALHILFFTLWVLFSRVFVSWGLNALGVKEKVVLIGSLPGLSEEKVRQRGFEILKRFDCGSLDINKLRQEAEGAGTVVFTSDFLKNKELVKTVFSRLPLCINYVPYTDFYEEVWGKVPLSRLEEEWFLKNLSRRQRKIDRAFKRGFDILFSLIGLVIFAVLFPLLALAVKISSRGPVFYSQTRVGQDGEEFVLYKLRTMTVGAEKNGPEWAKDKDPRVTKVGRFLRATHLDEWPQFFNVLKGELSFVGPRPERPFFVEKLKKEVPFYDVRHIVKPGFTGWAQINYRYGASIEDTREKLKYDLYYIKNKNILFDLSIILKTIRIIFKEM